ncbi:ParB/RepB/Spo0J family partition protein [Sandaracinus amylolyticus]|uniref:Partition protein, phage-associated n=1 Tax=Sandaracinus amylolyticus TaxID=927083 RepID=A0A0F6VZF3_9BACT|nr:ParB N-terminal domain-containing protein [Sandaracinus amylolyticus]AKF03383.1 Partition protein, phage-associated [Sandaracinus amylolyticus]
MEAMLRLAPEEVVVIGVDTAHKKGEHTLFDERVFLPLDDDMLHSIEMYGVLKPIFVRRAGAVFEVVDGRRRVLHAREVNRAQRERGGGDPRTVRAITEDGDDAHLFGLSRLANRGAKPEHPIQTAEAARELHASGKSLSEIAGYLNVGVPMVRNYLSLLELHSQVREAVADEAVTMTAALKLVVLPAELQVAALEELLRSENRTVAAALAVRNRLCTTESDGRSVREPPPPRRVVQRFLSNPSAFGLGHVSEDFWLGVRWCHGFVPSSRIRGMANAVRTALERGRGRKRSDEPRGGGSESPR